LRRVGDVGEHVGEPGMRIDIIELRGADQRLHDGSALGATVRTGEEPCLAAQSTERAFSCIVGLACARLPLIIDERDHGLNGRSSSAQAKYADAFAQGLVDLPKFPGSGSGAFSFSAISVGIKRLRRAADLCREKMPPHSAIQPCAPPS